MRVAIGIVGGVLLTLCSFYTVTHADAFNNHGRYQHNIVKYS
jgi:hypothetical protein